ncbi:unnamed protein product [Nezara viridula]|uniref:Major facilitator superfamily (MFS) profile domain-containing protein n=1 Tax=Nezara viridula TaxID=85310 RepID=A0A9P0DY38_NEZVI|nr:unnamed protein product [Nezara viridula]
MTPPDGGWGWVVVAASLIVSAIADGVSLSFGLLFPYLSDYFSASKTATAWIGSLFLSVPLLAGPFSSALVDRFGCRWMTIIGGLMGALGFALSAFLESLPLIYVTFGLISGLGLGLIYVTAVVSIAYWFDKKRTLATSLGAAGTGIGTFIYAPFTDYLLTEYGWRGALLLLAGNLLNMCVCGALMREPDGWGDSTCGDSEVDFNLDMSAVLEEADSPLCHSLMSLPSYIKAKEKLPADVVEGLISNETLYKTVLEKYPNILRDVVSSSAHDLREKSPSRREGHHLRHVRVHRNSVMYRGALLNMGKYRLRVSSCPNIYRNSMTTIAKEEPEGWREELAELLETMMDFSLFCELHFLLNSISTILLFTWFIIPYFYLAPLMSAHGYTETQASSVLSVIGVANTFGMIAMGWFGDRPWMNVTKTYCGCLLGTGLATLLMPAAVPYPIALVTAASFFGLFVSSNFSFTPTILVEMVPLDRFTTAYGLTLLCQGVGTLIGAPLAALIFDLFGSWELSFYLAGAWIIIAGLLMFPVPVTRNRKLVGKGEPMGGHVVSA